MLTQLAGSPRFHPQEHRNCVWQFPYNPSVLKVEAGGSRAPGSPQLHSELKGTLDIGDE